MIYRHTQHGTLVWWVLGPVIVFTLLISAAAGWHPVSLFVTVLLALFLLLFRSLTVEVHADRIELRFGPGWIRKTFHTRDVLESRTVRSPWYYGWGIRLIPGGWLFNVSGFDAVEIVHRNGKRYRIGTDRPEELLTAIRAACEG